MTSPHKTPTISIGMPVFNGAQFIEKAIESILAQTFEDFELIVVDNSSTDDTVSTCNRFIERDARVRLVQNETNIGAAPNFNKAFTLATGKYFKWAAHDDWIEPGYLAKCVEILDSRPDVALCHSLTRIYSEDEQVLEDYNDALDGLNDRATDRFMSVVKDMRLVFPVFGLMRTEEVRRTMLMGSNPGADRTFVAEMALIGKLFLHPERLYSNRKTVSARATRDNRSWWDSGERRASRPRVTLLAKSYLTAIKRSDLPATQKARVAARICRHFMTFRRFILLREWKYVVTSRIPLPRRAPQ